MMRRQRARAKMTLNETAVMHVAVEQAEVDGAVVEVIFGGMKVVVVLGKQNQIGQCTLR